MAKARSQRLARDLALCMQAVLLRPHGSNAVFGSFCTSRRADDSREFPGLSLQEAAGRFAPARNHMGD